MSGEPRLGQDPIQMPKADLAAAFAKPDRAAGLRRLSLSRDAAAPTGPAGPDDAAPGADPAVEPAAPPVSAQATKSRGAKTSTGVGEEIQPIVVYLPASLRERLRAHRATTGDPLTTIAFDAVEAAHANFDELLAPYRPTTGAGLFTHRAPRRIQHQEPQVQVGLRPSRADLAVLDQLAQHHNAPNRSALLAVALNLYLPKT